MARIRLATVTDGGGFSGTSFTTGELDGVTEMAMAGFLITSFPQRNPAFSAPIEHRLSIVL